jgi:hypothetical protein
LRPLENQVAWQPIGVDAFIWDTSTLDGGCVHNLEQVLPYKNGIITGNEQWLQSRLALQVPQTAKSNIRQRQRTMGCEFQELLDSYGIEAKPTTVKNPTANAIVEWIHGTLGEQLQATIFGADWSDDIDTLIQACAYALCATSLAQGTYLPAQLAFGHNLIFRQKVIIDWEHLKTFCFKEAIDNSKKENKKHLEHKYKVRDKVLLVFKTYELCNNPKILPSTYARGPFTIIKVIANRRHGVQCGAFEDTVSIRRITPYYPREE